VEHRYGTKGTLFDGVFFTDNPIAGATVAQHLKVEISRQNADLSEVKTRLAQKAKGIGATSIMNFRYGQRKHTWWKQAFTLKWDTESWYGEGDAVKI
jgi:hypothetical protein